MNLLGMLVFGGLVAAGVMLRRQREWHKRLMLCATVSILAPAFGRLLPMPLFGAAAPLVLLGAVLPFFVAGMIADLIVRGRIHPAYIWAAGAVLLINIVTGPLAFSPPAAALVRLIQSA